SRCQIVTSRLAVPSPTRKSGRYFTTGARRSILPCSTSRITAVVVTVFEIEASGKTVRASTGCASLTLRTPKPRIVAWPLFSTPSATPGTLYSRIFAVTRAASFSNAGSEDTCARGVVLTNVNTHRHTTAVARGIASLCTVAGLYAGCGLSGFVQRDRDQAS